MTSPRRRLLTVAGAPRSRVARSVGLGAATVLCGVGLMATAGYLISRAAERPAVLSLAVAIVCVRFFGLTRPIARYFERLVSHDLALRVLGRARVRVYERVEPLAPAQLHGERSGDLLARLVADVDALQNLHLRGTGPMLVAFLSGAVSVAVTAAFLPAAAVAAGLVLAGAVVPTIAGMLGRRGQSARRPRAARCLRSWSRPFAAEQSSRSTAGRTHGSRSWRQPTTSSSELREEARSPTAPGAVCGSSLPVRPSRASWGLPFRRTPLATSTAP